MKAIQFDEHGYLKPYEGIDATLGEVKEYFVDGSKNPTSRQALFENYRQYIERFKKEIFSYFEQWVNGSFVSRHPDPAILTW